MFGFAFWKPSMTFFQTSISPSPNQMENRIVPPSAPDVDGAVSELQPASTVVAAAPMAPAMNLRRVIVMSAPTELRVNPFRSLSCRDRPGEESRAETVDRCGLRRRLRRRRLHALRRVPHLGIA